MAAPPVAPSEAPSVPLVDTHAHLNDRRFSRDLDAVLTRAAAAGIGAMVVVGYNLVSSRAAVRLAAQHAQLWAAVGIHPHDARDATDAALDEVRRLAAAPKVVALGECGLDYYRDLSPREQQRRAFIAQLRMAADLGLPVIVHCREAMADTLDLLAREGASPPAFGGPVGVMHCFDGSARDAARAIELGLVISCAGTLTYRKDDTLARAIASVPADRLVVETDCPYLTPAGHRGERNEPAYVRIVAEAAARVRGESLAALASQTTANAAALFRTPAMAQSAVGSAA